MKNKKRIALIGSRELENKIQLRRAAKTFLLQYPNIELVSGGAKGADQIAEELAEEMGLKITIFFPNYHEHGKIAPLLRNCQIVNEADIILAIWDGKSKGTAHTLGLARQKGIPIYIIHTEMD